MQIQNEYYEEQSIQNKKFQNTIIESCKFTDCNFEKGVRTKSWTP